MDKIRIGGISSGNINGASSRLRFYYKLDNLPPDFLCVKKTLDVDLFYIQKCANQIPLIHKLRELKIPIVYDTDDGEGVRIKGNDSIIFPLVNAITTDTESRAEAFRKITDTPVYVVPDGIDYIMAPIKPTGIGDKIKRICTFGSRRSVRCSISYILPFQGNYQVSYITRKKIRKLKNCKFHKWTLHKFVETFQMEDLCILAHDEKEKKTKGNARLITAMSLGMPTITSNTPSSVELMMACGMGGFVVNNPGEVAGKIELLKNREMRLTMQKKFMEYTWANYKPKDMAAILADVFRKVINGKNTNIQQ